jgi:hypothetical protein
MAAPEKGTDQMKKLLLAVTMLAAATQAHASCSPYKGSLVAYWQQQEVAAKADRDRQPMFPQNRPIVDAAVAAAYARVIADSVLCEQNAISIYEYKARMLEAFTRIGQ